MSRNRHCPSPCFEWRVPFTSLLTARPGLEETTSSPRNAGHGCSRIVSDFYFLLCILLHFANFIQPTCINLFYNQKGKICLTSISSFGGSLFPGNLCQELHLQRSGLLHHSVGSFGAGPFLQGAGDGEEAVMCTVRC